MIAVLQRHERLYAEGNSATFRGRGDERWPRRRVVPGADAGGFRSIGLVICAVMASVTALGLAGMSLAGVGLATGSFLGALAIGPRVVQSRRDRKQVGALVAGLPAAVDAIARSLRSGMSLRHACESAARIAPPSVKVELTRVAADIAHGLSAAAAFRAWGDRSTLPEVRLVAAALAIASQHQGGAAQALSGVANGLRDRAALVAEIRSLTAQAAASMQAMVGLPVAFLVLDAVTNRRVVLFLVGEPVGRLCLVAGAALNIAGWTWMRTMIQRRLPQ